MRKLPGLQRYTVWRISRMGQLLCKRTCSLSLWKPWEKPRANTMSPALSDDVGILTWVPDSIIRKG
jgi:hypothetical protein